MITVYIMECRNIIAVNGDEKRLYMTKKLGAEWTVNFLEVNVETTVKEITKGKGADMVFPCIGSPKVVSAI